MSTIKRPYPNPIGIHGLVWSSEWSEASARSAISKSKEAGYDLIEILLVEPSTIDVPMTRRLLEEYELAAAGTLGLGPATDVSSEDSEVVAAGERLLADALSVGIDLGLTYFGGILHGALTKHVAPVSERGRANSIAAVARVCERAAGAGLPVGLELVNRYESNLLNTAAQAMEYIDEVGAQNLYVELDTYHMNIEEPGMFEAVVRCGDRLGYVQVGESHRGYLGSGNVNFDAFFRGLSAIGYAGPITFESFSSSVGNADINAQLATWRDVWSDRDDVADHARCFIDTRLRSVAAS